MGWKCTMSVSTSLWHPQTGYVSWMLLEVNNKISYRLFFPLQNTIQRALFSSIICLPKWTNDTETVWLDNKCVFQVLILNYCSGMCFCGSRWESVPTHEHQFSCIYSLSSSVFSSQLFSSHLAQNPFICDCNLKWLADYLRTNPIETSGARCASPRRLANKRIGQIKSKKFRCSGRPVAPCHSASSLLVFSISQTGFVVFLPLVSRCSSLTFCLSLCWEWLLSLHDSAFNERSVPAEGFTLPIICCAAATQSISAQMNLGPRREGLFAFSPLSLHNTTSWVWFHIQTAVSWDHQSRLVLGLRVSACAHHSPALCQS